MFRPPLLDQALEALLEGRIDLLHVMRQAQDDRVRGIQAYDLPF